ncbi:MAG TPA: hypothetical protein VGO60_01290, partial [Iamia sp.]|nr:hypothetical protein [Iamia sp.]
TQLVVSPSTATIAPGGSQRNTVEPLDPGGTDRADAPVDLRLSIGPDGSCTGAVCTAELPGVHVVTATLGSATGTATLVVAAPTTTSTSTTTTTTPTSTTTASGASGVGGSAGSTPTPGAGLARTGRDLRPLAILAAVLLAAGSVAVAATRRRDMRSWRTR